jgi:hypothetical protein
MRLDDLFRVVDDFTLPGGEVIKIRVLSDIELKVREDAMTKASVAVAREFDNEESESYQLNVQPLLESDIESIKAFLVATRATSAIREAAMEIRPNVIATPDDPERDEIDEIEAARDKEDERVREERAKRVSELVDRYRGDLGELEDDSIKARAKGVIVSTLAADARQRAFVIWTVHLATDRRFAPGELSEMNPTVVNAMMDKYREIDSVDPFGLASSS